MEALAQLLLKKTVLVTNLSYTHLQVLVDSGQMHVLFEARKGAGVYRSSLAHLSHQPDHSGNVLAAQQAAR